MTPAPSPEPETTSTRNRILDAAERIVAAAGAGNMTLDAVVQEARVSKGGLLYHFPNKEALLTGMVGRHCAAWDEAQKRKVGETSGSLGDHILALLDTHTEMANAKPREFSASILAASASNPQLLAEPRAKQAKMLAELAELSGDFPLALVLVAAIDGIALGSMLGLSAYTPEQTKILTEKLRELARTCSAS